MPFDRKYKLYFPQTGIEIWGREMAQCPQYWWSEFCPQDHMAEGENQVPQVISWSLYMHNDMYIYLHYGTYMYICTQNPVISRLLKE